MIAGIRPMSKSRRLYSKQLAISFSNMKDFVNEFSGR